jgi:hypothetical protein
VDNTLRDTLTIEMGQEINQVKVLEQDGAILANSLEFLGVPDGASVGGCVGRLLIVPEGGGGLAVGGHGCDR